MSQTKFFVRLIKMQIIRFTRLGNNVRYCYPSRYFLLAFSDLPKALNIFAVTFFGHQQTYLRSATFQRLRIFAFFWSPIELLISVKARAHVLSEKRTMHSTNISVCEIRSKSGGHVAFTGTDAYIALICNYMQLYGLQKSL